MPRMQPESLTWSFPGVPLEIHIQTSVAYQLERQVAAAGTGTVSEGGLLLGHIALPAAIEVNGFRPLPTLDTPGVERALGDYYSGEVVGFYRASRGGPLNVGEKDLILARNLFSESDSVELLMEAAEAGVSEAAVAFWHNGELTELPSRPLPCSGDQLAPAEQSGVARRRFRAGDGWPRALRPAALLAALAVAGAYFWSHTTPVLGAKPAKPPAVKTATAAEASLGLTAERRGPDLLLSWDATSPFISNAQFGILIIEENHFSRHIALAPDQLRAGNILYTVATTNLAIQLNVVAGDAIRHDSLVIMLRSR